MTSDAGTGDHRTRRRPSASEVIRVVAATLSAIAIVGFQSSFLPFFQALFVGDRVFWPVIFYGYWILAAGVAAAILILNSTVRRQSLPILLVCILPIGLS